MSRPEVVVEETFRATFGYSPTRVAQAPGRVNLIGEHTDYNDGFVLPCAINFGTAIASAKRHDNIVRVLAVDVNGEQDEFEISAAIPFDDARMWPNYIRGVTQVLVAQGYAVGGADLVVSGDVPQGAGLSSSASLETALIETYRTLYSLSLSDSQMALAGQQAENEFVGCSCGIMDQMISARGQQGHAMLLDCRSLEIDLVSMPNSVRIVIVNSNKQRGLVDSAYNERRQQCEAAARVLGVKALRDADMELLSAHAEQMDAVTLKRARHVITENDRTVQAVDALRQGDLASMGQLMSASHASMRDDFEITVPEIDYLVETLQSTLAGIGGARMTGGGFGGCVVALVPAGRVDQVVEVVQNSYEAHTGLKETIYLCTPEDGASHFTPVDQA